MNTDKSHFWQNLEGIAVINLDNRQDRWKQICDNAALHLNEAPPLTRISAVYGAELDGYGKKPWFRNKSTDIKWAGRAGCTQSHRKALEYAQVQGWKTFLILEDDADFAPLVSIDLNALGMHLFATSASWDICYLGFSKSDGPSFPQFYTGNHTCAVVTGCYTTHAYVIREKARDWILQQLPSDEKTWAWHAKHRIIDRWYVRNLSRKLKVTAITPSIITQAFGYSDILCKQVDYQKEFPESIEFFNHNKLIFKIRQKATHTFYIIGNFYDSFRALLKRFKGF